MPGVYHRGSRHYQDVFDTRRLADRIDERLVGDVIDDADRAFIARMEMFFLATADEQGHPTCSYKGGERGFVRVLDRHTIAFPSYDGNGMYLSAGNILVNPHVGLLFIDFERRRRMRLEGVASIDEADPLLAEYAEAQLVVRVRATHVYPNCPRYVPQMRVVERSRFVPQPGCETPVPAWKQREWSQDVLPAGDPASDPGRESLEA
jgi:predicted pyridoxine 5'-phosphate oxidase superfamily flavin-nucleotide-binding protein